MISHNVLLPLVARDGIFIQGTGSENLAGFIFDSMLRGLELILLRSLFSYPSSCQVKNLALPLQPMS